jgi:hypothetical protein
VRPAGAHQDLHERAFAGAVLAHQGVGFAGEDAQVDAFEGAHAGETLGDPAHLQEGLAGLIYSSLCTG